MSVCYYCMLSAEYGVSECDHEASIMRRPWPARGCCVMETKLYTYILCMCVCMYA
jgi:hypothetical protein